MTPQRTRLKIWKISIIYRSWNTFGAMTTKHLIKAARDSVVTEESNMEKPNRFTENQPRSQAQDNTSSTVAKAVLLDAADN